MWKTRRLLFCFCIIPVQFDVTESAARPGLLSLRILDSVVWVRYSLKFIEKVADLDSGVHSNGGLTDSQSATDCSVADLYKLVNTYGKAFRGTESSKVVNTDGTPMIVYHGTNEDLDIFDTSVMGSVIPKTVFRSSNCSFWLSQHSLSPEDARFPRDYLITP